MQLRSITVDVRLVPMLVPITTGIPLKSVTIVKLFISSSRIIFDIKDTCSTVIVSEATMATTREVVAEEDCSRDVAKIPMDSLDVNVDSDDGDVDDGGHDGDKYIMMKCLSVCVSRKMITSSCNHLNPP